MGIKNNQNVGKAIVFSFFLFFSLFIIIAIWVIELLGGGPVSPNYVRSTMTLPTPVGFELTLEALPTREHAPNYTGGSGQDEQDIQPAPSPTFNVDDWVAEEGISDDLADE